jgi:hypothetical protein
LDTLHSGDAVIAVMQTAGDVTDRRRETKRKRQHHRVNLLRWPGDVAERL